MNRWKNCMNWWMIFFEFDFFDMILKNTNFEIIFTCCFDHIEIFFIFQRIENSFHSLLKCFASCIHFVWIIRKKRKNSENRRESTRNANQLKRTKSFAISAARLYIFVDMYTAHSHDYSFYAQNSNALFLRTVLYWSTDWKLLVFCRWTSRKPIPSEAERK